MALIDEQMSGRAIKILSGDISRTRIKPEAGKEVISEGLRINKVSPRLYRLAQKIQARNKRNPSLELEETVRKITSLANEFEKAESLNDVGRKAEAKTLYRSLTEKYTGALKYLRKETVKEALKKTGSLALTIAGMTVPFLLMGRLFPSLDLGKIQSGAAERAPLQTAGLYLKRAGAFALCGIPVKAARAGLNMAGGYSDDKTIARIDRILKADRSIDYSDYDEADLEMA